jgi:GntR family galactonate operon transcriptional repressor
MKASIRAREWMSELTEARRPEAFGMEVKLLTLPRQVASVLVRRIATDDLPDGLSEQHVMQEFGVSRSVAREALRILATLDMVEIAQGRRVALRPASEWDYLSPLLIDWLPSKYLHGLLVEGQMTRLLIEPALAAMAARRMSDGDLDHLGELVEAMAATVDAPDVYLQHDLDFHTAICRAAGNRILDRFMYSSRWWQTASRRISNRTPRSLPNATEHHRAIYEALRARDPKRAEEQMRRHLTENAAFGLIDMVASLG